MPCSSLIAKLNKETEVRSQKSAGPPAAPDSTWLRLLPQTSGGLSASRFFRDQPMLEIKGLTGSHRPEANPRQCGEGAQRFPARCWLWRLLPPGMRERGAGVLRRHSLGKSPRTAGGRSMVPRWQHAHYPSTATPNGNSNLVPQGRSEFCIITLPR
jgi:hypothetical protein